MTIQKRLNSLSNNYKQSFCIIGIFFVAIPVLLFNFSFTEQQPETVNGLIAGHFQQLIASIDSLGKSVADNAPLKKKQTLFKRCRKNYKYIEAVVEFVSPVDTKYYINGPPIKKHSVERGNKVFEPHGFQLIEPLLFSNDTSLSKDQLIYEIKLLKGALSQTERKFKSVVPRTEQYFDLLQFELVRVISLNINGYDCAITKDNLKESIYVFEGMLELLEGLAEVKTKSPSFPAFKKLISDTKTYLSKNQNYNAFNRLHFIVTYIKPLYALMYTMRTELKLQNTPVNYPINFSEKNLFETAFFNKRFFSANIFDTANINAQAELGKNLFFDPVLSGNNKRACASCHKPQLAFADTVPKNLEYNRSGFLKRNTPSLLNVMYQKSFFADGRSLQLEDQISDVLHAKNEMNSLPQDVVNKLRQSDEYLLLFKKAFKGTSDSAISFYAVLKSISEFEKTLVSLNSRFDNYLKGNKKALTQNEINGYTIFSGKALCGSCHFLPLFNGLVPPEFNENEFEVIGVPVDPNSKEIDSDSGRVLITKKNIHLYSFKTPGVRNTEFSFPYMHNGSYKTIDQIIEFYNRGGGNILTKKIENQTLPFDSLSLTTKEKLDIKSFLLSLSDNPFKNIAPTKLPMMNDPVLNQRKIGGEY